MMVQITLLHCLAHIAVQMQAQKSWFYHPQIVYTSCQILEIMQEVLKIFLLFMHNIMLRIREVGIVVFVIN